MPTTSEAPWSVGTNILIYATAVDAPASKQRVARDLLEQLFLSPQACVAGQVLGEYLNVVLRKKTMTHAIAMEAIGTWSRAVRVLGASVQAYDQARQLTARHKYQVWDALIVAVCAEHGVKTLYSEVAGPLKRPLGVHVVNPFAKLEID
jgi:predicted nucleic acid-binding protein